MYMFGIQYIFTLEILCIFDQAAGLVTLPKVEENAIVKTEAVIRNTTNILLSSLKLTNIRNNKWIQEISLIHNYFMSLTLQDYNSLQEIAKLTRVDNSDIENETTNFIALINEILEEENVVKLQNILKDENVEEQYNILNEVKKLLYMKTKHANEDTKSIEINKKVLEILQQEGNHDLNVTTTKGTIKIDHSDENVLDEIPFWHESELLSTRRIFDGKRTKIKYFPFLASIQVFNKFQCAGSIIKSDLVITAASCLQLAWNNRFFRENPPFLSVRVGSSFYEMGGEVIGVQEIYFNPGYNPKNLQNNIALMRLERKIKLNKKRVKKIHLDKEDHKLPKHTGQIEILGWGATTRSNKLHGPWQDKLKYATLRIYPYDECQLLYNKEYVRNTNFCAGFLTKGTGACNRDLGGPGIISGTLIGVISFGSPSCGTPDAPTVLTKVGFYFDWIEKIMEQEVPHYNKKVTSKPSTWSYPKTFSQKLTSWTITPLATLRSSFSPNERNIKKIALRSEAKASFKPEAHKTTSKKAFVTNHKFKNIDEKMFKADIDTIFGSNETENYLEIEIPEKQHNNTTTENVLSVSFITPTKKDVVKTKVTKLATTKTVKKILRTANVDVQKPPLLAITNSKTRQTTINPYPFLVPNASDNHIIENIPTGSNVDLMEGKAYNFEKKDHDDYFLTANEILNTEIIFPAENIDLMEDKAYDFEKKEHGDYFLTPNEILNTKIKLPANNAQQKNFMESTSSMPIEVLQNYTKQLVKVAAQEQEYREKELKMQISQMLKYNKIPKNEIKEEDNQNIELDDYIKQVLNSKLNDHDKHDIIIQLVSAKKPQVEKVRNKVMEPVIKAENSKEDQVEDLDRDILRLVDSKKSYEGKDALANYQEDSIQNVLTDIRLNNADKLYLLSQILTAKRPEVKENLNTIFKSIDVVTQDDKGKERELEFNMVHKIETTKYPRENKQIDYIENIIEHVQKDSYQQDVDRLNILMQAANAKKIPNQEMEKRIMESINEAVDAHEKQINTNSLQIDDNNDMLEKKYALMNQKENNLNKVLCDSKLQEKEKHDICMQLISADNLLVEKMQKLTTESVDVAILNKKVREKELNRSILQIINNNEEEINLKQVFLDSNLKESDKIDFIMRLISAKNANEQHNIHPEIDSKTYPQQEQKIYHFNNNALHSVTNMQAPSQSINNVKPITKKKYVSDLSLATDNQLQNVNQEKLAELTKADEKYDMVLDKQENILTTQKNAKEYSIFTHNTELSPTANEKNIISTKDEPLIENYNVFTNNIDSIEDNQQQNNLLQTAQEKIIQENDKNQFENINVTEVITYFAPITAAISNQMAKYDKMEKYDITKNQKELNESTFNMLNNSESENKQNQPTSLQLLGFQDTGNILRSNLRDGEDTPIEELKRKVQQLVEAAARENENRNKEINFIITQVYGTEIPRTENMQVNGKYSILEQNIQQVLSNRKIEDKTKFEYIMQLIGANSGTTNESDTPQNYITKAIEQDTIPFEELQYQIKQLLKAETQEKEEREKLIQNQIIQIMNNTDDQLEKIQLLNSTIY